jgi:hypothetical protein
MSDATMAEIAKARRNWKDDHLGVSEIHQGPQASVCKTGRM